MALAQPGIQTRGGSPAQSSLRGRGFLGGGRPALHPLPLRAAPTAPASTTGPLPGARVLQTGASPPPPVGQSRHQPPREDSLAPFLAQGEGTPHPAPIPVADATERLLTRSIAAGGQMFGSSIAVATGVGGLGWAGPGRPLATSCATELAAPPPGQPVVAPCEGTATATAVVWVLGLPARLDTGTGWGCRSAPVSQPSTPGRPSCPSLQHGHPQQRQPRGGRWRAAASLPAVRVSPASRQAGRQAPSTGGFPQQVGQGPAQAGRPPRAARQ